jgi:hypothetical protein
VLRFETPYGELSAAVGRDGKLSRSRVEADAGDVADGFRAPVLETTTGYGRNFLRWTSGAPAGHIGNPAVLHRVTGGRSYTNALGVTAVRNSLQVFRGANSVSGVPVVLFEVAGQCYAANCS